MSRSSVCLFGGKKVLTGYCVKYIDRPFCCQIYKMTSTYDLYSRHYVEEHALLMKTFYHQNMAVLVTTVDAL